MRVLLLNTKSEFLKLINKKKYLVITILSALICLMRLGGSMLITKVSRGELVIKGNLISSMLSFVADILVPLVVFMAVTDLFSSEMQEDTFKESLMRPLTRFKVMISKCAGVWLLSCAVMLVMFIACFIMQIISGNGLGGTLHMLSAYLIDMIPVIALIGLALFINAISKSPTLAMLLCIVVYIFFKYLNLYVSPFGQMIFTAYSQWHKIWLGSTLPIGALASKLGILFGSVLILYTASYIIIENKDF